MNGFRRDVPVPHSCVLAALPVGAASSIFNRDMTKMFIDGVNDGGLSCSGSAGDDHDLAVYRRFDCLDLIGSQRHRSCRTNPFHLPFPRAILRLECGAFWSFLSREAIPTSHT